MTLIYCLSCLFLEQELFHYFPLVNTKGKVVSIPQCNLIVNHEHLSFVSLWKTGQCFVKFSGRSVIAQNG